MARFTFQLQSVLEHHERVEKDRQRALAVLLAAVVPLEAELRGLQEQSQQNAAEVLNNRLVGRLDMNYLAAHRRYMLGVQRKAMDLARRIAEGRAKVEEGRRHLLEATRRRKTFEKLRERQYERWLADRNRRESAELDELTTQLSYAGALRRAEGEA